MGEYATHNGEQVKIGTCENFYYLRADQRSEIEGYDFDAEMLGVVRFRFPFPDEDGTPPGSFDDYDRGYPVPSGYSLPAELSGDEHRQIQFTSPAGYNLCIPCPEQFGQPGMSVEVPISAPSHVGETLRVHRNGFNGGPVVRQQAFRGGQLVTLLSCGACGALHRLDTIADAEPVIEAFGAEAERTHYNGSTFELYHGKAGAERLLAIAERIAAGYGVTVDA